MPLGETLTILATLANAVQVLRTTNRPTEAPAVESAPVVDTMALMAFEFAKTSNEAAVVRHDSALSRLSILFGASAVTLLVGAFLGAVSSNAPEGSSPLFLVSVVLFAIVCLSVIGLRRAFGLTHLTLRDFSTIPGNAQWESLERFVDHARRIEDQNQRQSKAIEVGTNVLILLIAAQAVIAAVWLIS